MFLKDSISTIMAWLGSGGMAELASDLKRKTDLEPEPEPNREIEKIDDETLERLKKATNLNEKEIEGFSYHCKNSTYRNIFLLEKYTKFFVYNLF